TSGNGTIFKLEPDGSGFTVVHSFAGSPSDGDNPAGSLTVSGGILYGMTLQGGGDCSSSDLDWRTCGTIFRIGLDGSGFGLLLSFPRGDEVDSLGASSLTAFGRSLYTATGSVLDNGGGALRRIDIVSSGVRRHLPRA
ncbi:MAG TPA: choice-of-anchor tandem repeat GloVer-containing protein, partial [Thermoanaerobaculaceae bacterium]|nr:choice-of-anchor tandem repeat GloVer-containing protein [Thermoanaerobaculaceae bacterium]